MRKASAAVVGSPTVGPEAITAGSSPGTSEIASVSSGAGQAASARRPPLIAERCLRTQLISPIAAPERNKASVSARFCASVIPGAGAASSAEPPPEISASTRSLALSPETRARIRAAAAAPAASGTGCAASTISMREQGTPCP
ncbi:hypothetical protein SDC9_175282 [bioreactor metagenome]|uniref:Uncharacterized protein n=1 Tax=bioreactor metagenome TaxID=1076179 RepID=A0A645GLQ3_9ZZZZ